MFCIVGFVLLSSREREVCFPVMSVFTVRVVLALRGFPGGAVVKRPPASSGDARDVGLIPGWERCPGGGNGSPLQHSCLEHPVDRGAWWAPVHGAAESDSTATEHHAVLAL